MSGADDSEELESLREDWEAYRREHWGRPKPHPPFAEWRIRFHADVANALQRMKEAEPWAGDVLVVCGIDREARLAAPYTGAILPGGGDVLRLGMALDWMSAKEATAAALSFGLAGGLDPALEVGDLVCARNVWDGERDFPTDPVWTARIVEATGARVVERILGRGLVAAHPTSKAELHASTGAAAVDMESHLLARWAHKHGTPLAVLRAVSDAADDQIPSSALAGFGGPKPKVGAVLKRLAMRPAELPALVGTARNVDRALRRLAEAADALGEDLGFQR